VKTSAREECTEFFLNCLFPTGLASVFVFQIDEVETNFLSEISISEFSHSQDPIQTFEAVGSVSPLDRFVWPCCHSNMPMIRNAFGPLLEWQV
jgi:hypothetical protein